MTGKLVGRLQDIPGVAGVTVNLEEDGGGINVRLEPGADESEVLERVRSLLVAYSVRSQAYPPLRIGHRDIPAERELGVDVRITPIKGGARVEVIGETVRSFRVVPPDPTAIAQGMSDAWNQVLGRAPAEITSVSIADDGRLIVVAATPTGSRMGESNVSHGWAYALTRAVAGAIGAVEVDQELIDANLPGSAW